MKKSAVLEDCAGVFWKMVEFFKCSSAVFGKNSGINIFCRFPGKQRKKLFSAVHTCTIVKSGTVLHRK